MDATKSNELVLVFSKDLMYGFSGLLPENYPESSIIHGVSDDVEDVAWLDECGARGFFMP